MNPLLERPSVLLAKIETTKGTAEALTTAEGVFNAMDVDFKETTPYITREQQGGAGKNAGVPGAMMGTASFRIHLENSGTSTDPLFASTFFPSCGMPGSTHVYTRTLDTSLQKCVTLAHCKGAGTASVRQTLTGACGKMKFVVVNGVPTDIMFEYTGKYTSEGAVTQLAPTFPTTSPPRGYESFTVNSVAPLSPGFTLDFGQSVKLLEGANDSTSSGYVHAIVQDYQPTLSFDPYFEALSVVDWRALFVAKTQMALSAVIGTGSNNIITLAASALQVTGGPGFGKRERVWTRNVVCDINDLNGPTVTFS